MIDALHLLWIVPTAAAIGFVWCAKWRGVIYIVLPK